MNVKTYISPAPSGLTTGVLHADTVETELGTWHRVTVEATAADHKRIKSLIVLNGGQA